MDQDFADLGLGNSTMAIAAPRWLGPTLSSRGRLHPEHSLVLEAGVATPRGSSD